MSSNTLFMNKLKAATTSLLGKKVNGFFIATNVTFKLNHNLNHSSGIFCFAWADRQSRFS